MSYDFNLFRAEAGRTAEEILAAEVPEGGVWRVPIDPAKDARNQRVVAGLKAINPELELFRPDPATVAASQKISIEAARLQCRHTELSDTDEDYPIQVSLFDDTGAITIAYGSDGQRARAVLERAWQYLKVVVRETGWAVDDPQLERVIELDRDFEEVLGAYGGGTARTHEIAKGMTRRPWWKFW